jgi:metallo-beta-lactamase family protein
MPASTARRFTASSTSTSSSSDGVPVATLRFLGAAGTVTGSKFALESDGRTTLIDCGLFQGLKELRLRNWEPLPLPARAIDRVVLTHAHIDHSGFLPRLIRAGFDGEILATHATRDLLGVLLPDSGRLQEEEARFRNETGRTKHRPALPLYTEDEGAAAAARVTGVPWEEPVSVGRHARAAFRRAGHILGAASVHIELPGADGGRRIVFSGDIGRYGAPILHDPAPLGEADYVVVESTYGNRTHDPTAIDVQLERAIGAAVARGGGIIVPAFAIGRTQDLLYHLGLLQRAGRVPPLRVYLDSPMAIDATGIYARHPEEFDEEMRALLERGRSPLRSVDVRLARTPQESRAINAVEGPVLIISASGMATGGRVLHHLRRRLPDPRTTVVLVGYQVAGTRGRQLEDGARFVRIFGEDVAVRAHVTSVHGLSAHADADGVLRWLRSATRPPRRVFVVHGEPAAAQTLAERFERELGWPATVPQHGDVVTLT